MSKQWVVRAFAAIGFASLSLQSHALVVGLYSTNELAEAAAASIATTQGHTAVQLDNVGPASLDGLDVLWILNPSNFNYDLLGGNAAAVSAFVSLGGVLSFHDRRVTEAATVLPGGSGIAFTRSEVAEIDVVDNSTLVTNGPGGVIDNATLDGGNLSNHGYADLGSLPAGAIAILSNGNANQIVDFSYAFGAGAVYYSTIPLDFHLVDGSSNLNFKNVYAPNELAYQASLFNEVPEPATIALLGLGLLGLGLRRRAACPAPDLHDLDAPARGRSCWRAEN